jgi:sulfite exporter TauE/SafE
MVLGLVGARVGLNLEIQLLLQGLAVIFMLATAANLLELHPVFRYIIIQPPKIVGKWLKKTTKSASFFTPVLLGLLTVLVPCGVTQAMMVFAISTGNAWFGALTMFFFVLGTVPIFFVVGLGSNWLSQKNTLVFNKIAAMFLVILSLYNLNGILRVLDSPLSGQRIIQQVDTWAQSLAGQMVEGGRLTQGMMIKEEDGIQKVLIKIKANGYEPNEFTVKMGIPVELTLETSDVYSCASAFTFKKYQIFKQLKPTDQQTVTFTPTEKGIFQFSCSMGMYGGRMRVI